ncbi:GTP-binding protein [Methylobacterium sp. SyP6R]|uniref:GTP-binding protein n=1 Tax=Methylobacterium sp. SyP6R TaxID=2718876 RepID=UPI001F1A3E36|nr:GTP-binding protein [Methylobacterium sp. SyP6R]MCF4129543.1 GTP-binding protein [Methylobacterium sp. SyP6R]
MVARPHRPNGEQGQETEAYGIRSVVFRARRPLHPREFHDLVARGFPCVIRDKEHFWIASRPLLRAALPRVGDSRSIRAGKRAARWVSAATCAAFFASGRSEWAISGGMGNRSTGPTP